MRSGFTLIELMVVVLILGIMAAIAIPRFTDVSEGAKQAACRTNQRLIVQGLHLYFMDEGDTSIFNVPTWVDPTLDGYVPQDMECQTAKVKYAFAVYYSAGSTDYNVCAWGVGATCWLNHGYIWNNAFVNWD